MRILIAGLVGVSMALSVHADSLFNSQTAQQGTLVSLKTQKFRPGDIITVVVQETIDASTDANTNTKKESDVASEANAEDNAFLVTPKPDGFGITTEGKLPNWGIEAENELRATGKTIRKNKLITTVTCVVQEVFDNGTLLISGEKTVSVNREDSRLLVQGIIRARDVSPENTVQSAQMANAVIQLSGRGPLWNNQRRGLITRLLDWVSPF